MAWEAQQTLYSLPPNPTKSPIQPHPTYFTLLITCIHFIYLRNINQEPPMKQPTLFSDSTGLIKMCCLQVAHTLPHCDGSNIQILN